MSETARWALPLLTAGQAQKEMTHNEALATLDLLVSPEVAGVGVDTPPVAPVEGQCWAVGSAPSGVWSGRAGALAGWTGGGWRYAAGREGMTLWNKEDGTPATFLDGQWRAGRVVAGELWIGGRRVVGARGAPIPAVTGGTVVDAEARVAIDHVIAALIAHGLIAA